MSETVMLGEGAGPAGPPGQLLGAGLFVMRHASVTRTLRSPTWLLELMVNGALEVQIAGEAWRTLAPGSGVLYAPGTGYCERCPQKRSSQSVCVFFHLEASPAAPLRGWTRLAPPYRLIDDRDQQLTPLVRRITQDLPRPGPARLWALGCFHQAMSLLLAATSDDLTWRIGGATGGDDLVSDARRYMQENLHRPLQVADLARRAGLTASGFAHAYRRSAGCSPMRDLRRIRVEAAQAHLLRQRMTLAQIAQQTGFADAFHLSHAFRRMTGLSPRAFRRQAGGQDIG
jgi:AraC-like DNA-binding protein